MPPSAASTRGRVVVLTLLSLVALALGPVWSLADAGEAAQRAEPTPPSLRGWTGPGLNLSDWHPVFANPDEEFLVAYQDESGDEVALYHAVYRSQRQGKELRGHGNSVLGKHYQPKETHRRELVVAGGVIAVTEQLAAGAGQHDLLVWSLFAVDGRPDPMGFPSQLAYGIRSLRQSPTASVVAFAAECRPDCDSARRSLDVVAVQALPVLLSSPEAGRMVVSASRNE